MVIFWSSSCATSLPECIAWRKPCGMVGCANPILVHLLENAVRCEPNFLLQGNGE